MAFLEFINASELQGRKYFSQRCTIGRTSDNNLCVNERLTSRNHAEVRFVGTHYVIEDTGSKNGTIVNSVQLESRVERSLYDGDEIIIASTVMEFFSEGKQPPPIKKDKKLDVVKTLDNNLPMDVMDGISVIMQREKNNIFSGNAIVDATQSVFDIDKNDSKEFLQSALKRFQAMVGISAKLGAIVDNNELLEKIMDSIFDIFPQADRSFIMLRDRSTNDMTPMVGRRRNSSENNEETFEISQTILKQVVDKKQSILSSNASQDERFMGGQSITDFSIRSLMYVPFVIKEEILGIISVDTTSCEKAFNKDDLEMLTGIAAQAAVALKNVELYDDIQKETQSRTQLSRYLSPDIVEGILDGTIPLRLGGEEKYGTILFCDIVGFTRMSESLSAVEVIEKLNRYYLLVTEVVTRNKGTLHKFEGDMVMAFWNVMFEDPMAEMNAVHTGLAMQIAVWLFGLELEAEGQMPIHIGVGCNTGEFAGGNIGGNDIMEYTVIGDNINIGKRIESLAGRWQVFIAERTHDHIAENCISIELPLADVKGKSKQIKAFSIRGLGIDEQEMALCIPVLLKVDDKNYTQRGILYKSYIDQDRAFLHLYSSMELQNNDQLTFKFDLPEVIVNMEIEGSVRSAVNKTTDGIFLYSKIIMTNFVDMDKVTCFFKQGNLIESTKEWDDIKRQ